LLPVALVVEVEVALPAVTPQPRNLDGTADVDAVVVLVELGVVGGAPLLCTKPLVAVELESGPMEGTATRLGDRHDLARRRRAVFRRVVRGQHFDLADHVGRHREVLEDRDHAALAHEALLHAYTIDRSLVARLQAAISARIERVVPTTGRHTWHQR